MNHLDDLITSKTFYRDPYPIYAQLREVAPIFWSEAWGGWVLTRYDDIVATLRDPQRFSSAGRIAYLLQNLSPEMRSEMTLLEQHYRFGIAHSDPPAHSRLRALLTPFFAPRYLEPLRANLQALLTDLLDQVANPTRFDLIATLAYPLPAIVVLEMLGAPRNDMGLFRQWALDVNTLFAKGGKVDSDSAALAQKSLLEMRQYIAEMIRDREYHPRNDLLSHLLRQQEGERLSHAELVSTAVTLFVAGHETTTNLIGNGVLALLRNREQWAQLCHKPEQVESAVEELLRYDTPVQRGWRIATEDVELAGQPIRKGQMILQMIGSANRDPAHFAQPEKLDINRHPSRHLGLGIGIHFCLGAPLARMEVSAALQHLSRRFPNLALDESVPLCWRQDVALRGVEELWVVAESALKIRNMNYEIRNTNDESIRNFQQR